MRTAEYRWSQVRVGLFVAITGIILFAAVFYFGLVGSPLSRQATIYGNFEDFSGLAVGSPVELAGVQVGTVVRVDLPDIHSGKLPVTLSIEPEALQRLGESSYAYTSSHALVGQRFVGITLRKPTEPPLKNGSVINTRVAGGFDNLPAEATEALKDLRALLADLKGVTSSLNTAAMNINEGRGTIGKLLNDEKLYTNMTKAAANARDLTERITNGKGPLPALLSDARMTNDLRTSLSSLAETSQRIREGKGVIGKLTNDDVLAGHLGKTLENFEVVSSRLTEAQGALGALISDPAMLNRVNDLLAEMESLAADVRRNPQRYLRVQAF